MRRQALAVDVFEAAVRRLYDLYAAGHRVVVSFSGGKDSGVVLEVAIIAARRAGRLPVDVVMRDEEIMFPGTFEYAERVALRPEVRFHWLVAHQPIVNVFNREQPYWWVFDPLLPPQRWVRQPPDWAIRIPTLNIDSMTTPERFPPAPGKHLYAAIGLRVQESMGRLYGLFSAGGHITRPNRHGVRNVWPIYDWTDADVWRAIAVNKWDVNEAYNVLHRLGLPRERLRIAPPTLTQAGVPSLRLAAKAWPKWFDRVCQRLPGVRAVVHYGLRAVQPHRRLGETWERCFWRTCVEEAPAWIAERARRVAAQYASAHARHSTAPLPEVEPCYHCQSKIGSWRMLAHVMYNGDPFSMKAVSLPYVEPEAFRPGAGTWQGRPTW